MTLGRPMMTPCQITVPLPTTTKDDKILDLSDISQVQFCPSQMTFYIQAIKLYLILGKILLNVYKPWAAHGTNQDFDDEGSEPHSLTKDLETVMSLDEEISNFEDNIPSWLHWKRGINCRESLVENQRLMLLRQTSILHAR